MVGSGERIHVIYNSVYGHTYYIAKYVLLSYLIYVYSSSKNKLELSKYIINYHRYKNI